MLSKDPEIPRGLKSTAGTVDILLLLLIFLLIMNVNEVMQLIGSIKILSHNLREHIQILIMITHEKNKIK